MFYNWKKFVKSHCYYNKHELKTNEMFYFNVEFKQYFKKNQFNFHKHLKLYKFYLIVETICLKSW